MLRRDPRLRHHQWLVGLPLQDGVLPESGDVQPGNGAVRLDPGGGFEGGLPTPTFRWPSAVG